MAFELIIEEHVYEDVLKVAEYYDDKVQGLGERFEETLNASLELLSRHPFFAVRYDAIRCYHLPFFPYTVHYHVDEAGRRVIVLAVLHRHKNPDENWLWDKN
ncbi:MAG: type II toxin-antitoxin system RelE/ParE family toxin [Bacteroidetes bacterium]|nr:type II toxin-antitoxin system RelE/ParE family toxin [Bacteroidota bacterium]